MNETDNTYDGVVIQPNEAADKSPFNPKEWQVEWRDPNELTPYAKNARKNDRTVPYLINSIKRFGFKVPIVVDKDDVVVCGHTRLKAALQIGYTKVPCVKADDLSEQEIKAFRLADNKIQEISEWDDELLANELDELKVDFDEDMEDFSFGLDIDGEDDDSGVEYSMKVENPDYEPTGRYVNVNELANTQKTDELLAEIKTADIPDEIRKFLTLAAYRHTIFNYRDIAEYYAKADKGVQELMEKSALVIIDFNDAIKNGFVEVNKKLISMRIADMDNGGVEDEE